MKPLGTAFSLMLFMSLAALILVDESPAVAKPNGCCVGRRGNVDGLGIIDLGDLTGLVDYLTSSGYVPPCLDAANVDGQGVIDLGDLTMMVDYLSGLPVTFAACPADSVTITIPQRMAALDSVDAHYDALIGQSHDSIAQALSAYLKTQPLFEAAGISDKTTVWARFKDGRLLIIPNNTDPDFPPDSGTVDTVSQAAGQGTGFLSDASLYQPLTSRAMAPIAAASIPPELPSSGEAFLLSSMSHRCFTNPLPTIKNLLERQNYYCHVGTEGIYASNGTIENLMGVHDAGILYLDGHGGMGKLRDSTPIYGLWTADVVTDFVDSADDAMLTSGELCYMDEVAEKITTVRTCGVIRHYGITPRFVANHMTFAKNALVFIDCCSSSADPNFQTAFTNAGASMFLGWTTSVSDPFAVKTAYYIFDRLLGTNAISPVENPRQRPFDVQAVFTDMANRGLTLDQSTGADIVNIQLKDHMGLLAPTTKFISIYEDRTQCHMLLSGEYGSDRGNYGTVTVNGQPVFVVFWSPDSLVCDIDGTGGQAVGKVQAYVIPTAGLPTPSMKQLSNPVNITEWNGTMSYTLSGPDSLKAELDMGIHFRSDVHPFREKPHQKPFKTLTIFQTGLKDSTGKATWSGEHSIPADPCQQKIVMTGSDDMGNCWKAADHGAFKYDGGVDMIHNQLQFNLTYGAGDTIGHMYYSGPTGCPNYDFSVYLQVQNDSCLFNVLPNDVMQLTMSMDSTDYSIKSDSTSCSRKAIYWIYYFDQASANAQIKWTKWTAKFPPDPKAGE